MARYHGLFSLNTKMWGSEMAMFRIEKRMKGSSGWSKGAGSNSENSAIQMADRALEASNVQSVRVRDEQGHVIYSNSK